jgi:hypothetical protein
VLLLFSVPVVIARKLLESVMTFQTSPFLGAYPQRWVPLPMSSVRPSRYRVLGECEPGEPGVWLEDVESDIPALGPAAPACVGAVFQRRIATVLAGAVFRPRLLPADALNHRRQRETTGLSSRGPQRLSNRHPTACSSVSASATRAAR